MNHTSLLALVLLSALSLSEVHAAQQANCVRTQGSSQSPNSAFPPSEHWYGSEKLAVQLRPDGVWRGLGPAHNFRDKLFLWSAGFEPGDESNLKVMGKRLDADAPPAKISKATNAHAESLGGWTMLVMVELPTPGCWQISAEYLGESLTFVVEALAAAASTSPAT